MADECYGLPVRDTNREGERKYDEWVDRLISGKISPEQKERMIRKAREQYGPKIFPCCSCSSLSQCFTIVGSKVLFWFNLPSLTTRTVMEMFQ